MDRVASLPLAVAPPEAPPLREIAVKPPFDEHPAPFREAAKVSRVGPADDQWARAVTLLRPLPPGGSGRRTWPPAAERRSRCALGGLGPRRQEMSFCRRCSYNDAMGVAITFRDVPDKVRDELAARAARAGMSLQEYLRGMLVESASRPAVDDVIARARARVEATGARVDAKSIIAARDADRR